MLWGKRRDSCKIVASINLQLTELLMQKPNDNSKAGPAAFMQDNTLITVSELSLINSLVAGLIPGVSRVVPLVRVTVFSVRHGLRIVALHGAAAPARVQFGGGKIRAEGARKQIPICEKTCLSSRPSRPFVWSRYHVSTVRVASH
jgi:hypothetical protein